MFRFSLDFDLLFVCFCHFLPLFFAFAVSDLVSSILRQQIGSERRLQNDLFRVAWDVEP